MTDDAAGMVRFGVDGQGYLA
ncbi:MAG: hypothetical protein QOJ83_2321, partial [Frankiales bacterium]|nr:hypothetical protein [Frankiales bacterium]